MSKIQEAIQQMGVEEMQERLQQTRSGHRSPLLSRFAIVTSRISLEPTSTTLLY